MTDLIRGCDVLVHEATIGPLPQDFERFEHILGNLELQPDAIEATAALSCKQRRLLEKKIHSKGHSTAIEAAAFAREMKAKQLILNHISNRYDYLDDAHYVRTIQQIKSIAMVVPSECVPLLCRRSLGVPTCIFQRIFTRLFSMERVVVRNSCFYFRSLDLKWVKSVCFSEFQKSGVIFVVVYNWFHTYSSCRKTWLARFGSKWSSISVD